MTIGIESYDQQQSVYANLWTLLIQSDLVELFATQTEVQNARDGSANLLAQINSLQSLISALTANGLYNVCTSSTRPSFGGISNGVLIYETDTGNHYFADCDNSKWILGEFNKYATGSIPSAGSTYSITTGTTCYDTTTTYWNRYNGSAWVNVTDPMLKKHFLL